MREYRIIKYTYRSGRFFYVIQKRCRLFCIGPKVWETYSEGASDGWSNYNCWRWKNLVTWRKQYDSVESANEDIRLMECEYYNSYRIEKEIVSNFIYNNH